MSQYQRNLVLVHTTRLQARSDFEAIKLRLAERAPDVEVFIVDNDHTQSVTRRAASQRPSLVFSPVGLRRFRPVRGKVYTGRSYTKFEEFQRLVAAGIRVPESVMLHPHTRLDPATWGPFAIVKPNVGRQGKGVRLHRTRDVHWIDPFGWPRNDVRFGCQMMVQRFVDSGPLVTSYRVMTVFGECIYSSVNRAPGPLPHPLDPAGDEQLDLEVAANRDDGAIELNFDSGIIDYAKEVARALPDLPVLGIDLIREEVTDTIYALEVNPSGLTWHISSDYGRELHEEYGVDYPNQFGAIEIIANALIAVTRRDAE